MNDLSQNNTLLKNTKIELNTRHPISVDLDTLRDHIYTHNSIDSILRAVKWVGAKKSFQIQVKSQSRFDVTTLSDGGEVDRSLNFSRLMCGFVANIELQALAVGYSFKLVDVVPVEDAEVLISICRRDNGSLIEVSNNEIQVSELPESAQDLIQDKLKEQIFRDGLEGALYQAVSDSLKYEPVITKNSLLHKFTESNYKIILDDLVEGSSGDMWLGRALGLLKVAKGAIPQYQDLIKTTDMTVYDFKCLLSLDELHHLWHLYGDEEIGGFLKTLPGFDPVYTVPGRHPKKTFDNFGYLVMQITRTIDSLSLENKWVD